MRKVALVGFLSLWIFSILAPSVMVIMDSDQQEIWVIYHSEEEQKESDTMDSFEEKIIADDTFSMDFYQQSEMPQLADMYQLGDFSHVDEVIIPPPEHLI